MKKTNKKKGFTIVELVIVIAVIAILAAVLIPTFSNVIAKANENAAMQVARNEFTNFLADDEDHVATARDYIIIYNGYAFVVDDNQFNATGTKLTSGTETTLGVTLKDTNATANNTASKHAYTVKLTATGTSKKLTCSSAPTATTSDSNALTATATLVGETAATNGSLYYLTANRENADVVIYVVTYGS